jgi:hypothetical protein
MPFGKCDIVPRECFVATEFQHFAFLPVIPIRTWVIIEGSETSSDDCTDSFQLSWSGTPIPFSAKSLLLAWIRALMILVMIAAGIYLAFLVLLWIDGRGNLARIAITAAIFGSVYLSYWCSYRFAYASPTRTEYLRYRLALKFDQS